MLDLQRLNRWYHRAFIIALVFVIIVIPLRRGDQAIYADLSMKPVGEVRTIYPGEWGGEPAAGLAYSTLLRQFFALDGDDSVPSAADRTVVSGFTPYEDLVGTVDLPFAVADAVNIAYDDSSNRLFLLSPDLTELIQIKLDSHGIPDPATATSYEFAQLGLKSAQGMAIDGEGRLLFILDGMASQIVRIALQDDLSLAEFDTVALAPKLDGASLRGLSLNPATRHLYVLDHKQQVLSEIGQSGELIAQYALSTLELTTPLAVTFAPSADLTDDPSIVHLFIADSGLAQSQDNQASFPYSLYLSFLGADQGGQGATSEATEVTRSEQDAPVSKIVEVTLDPAEVVVDVASTNVVVLSRVQTVELRGAQFDPPIPDPSGMAYIAESPTATSGHLLVSDAEVEESVDGNPPAYFEGVNLFGIAVPPATQLSYTASTLSFSNEPVGVAYNFDNAHTYIVDDGKKKVFELDEDGAKVNEFSTTVFNSNDPEGLEYLGGFLFIADGTNKEVYKVNLNGGLEDNFDTGQYGISDPSGLGHDPTTGNLLLVGGNNNPDELFEFTTAGALVQTYDISAANGRRLDSVVMAPNSNDPATLSYYIADRRQDNNANRLENDGAIYEFTAAGPPPPPPPSTGDKIFVSSTSGGNVAGVRFADEDILIYDIDTSTWLLFFDGSDAGLATLDLNAFSILDDGDPDTLDDILLSFSAPGSIGSLTFDDSDILLFTPSSYVPNTAGTFQMYFDGSDVGLDVNAEDIDAISIVQDETGQVSQLLLSTSGNGTVGGVSFKDESLLAFTPTSLFDNTSGSWSLYFNGTQVGLNTASSEDVNGAWTDQSNGSIYLTTIGAFSVPGASGDGADIFICEPVSPDPPIANCIYHPYWDGSAHGFAGEIADAIEIDKASTLLSSATMAALSAMEHRGEGDDPNADLDEGPDDVPDQENQLFLPYLQP